MAGVRALIVNHDGERLLGACLEALLACLARHPGPARAVVVDNASSDRSVELVRRRFPAVEVVERAVNDGFGAGVNAGLAGGDEEWALLVNSDMTLAPTALERLLAAAAVDPRVGAAGAQIRFAADPDVINSAGVSVDVLGVAADRLAGLPLEAGGGPPREVFGVSAGAALYRRAMLADIGGFDEAFFLYLEDVDVAWRARARGWRALYVPDAVAWHRHSATARHGSPAKHFHVGRNRVRLLARNATAAQLRRHGPRMVAHDLLHCAYVAATARTAAPLRGRVAGLREWRAERRAADPAPVALDPAAGLRAALARNSAWRRYSDSASAATAANAAAPRSTA
ncbi:MAG: glycosyltransferase family 2 protein [Solirubrobacterales bacterium]|nr:glycosyltransferase family 2 protein [Solirubrobacterales bacterium]